MSERYLFPRQQLIDGRKFHIVTTTTNPAGKPGDLLHIGIVEGCGYAIVASRRVHDPSTTGPRREYNILEQPMTLTNQTLEAVQARYDQLKENHK